MICLWRTQWPSGHDSFPLNNGDLYVIFKVMYLCALHLKWLGGCVQQRIWLLLGRHMDLDTSIGLGLRYWDVPAYSYHIIWKNGLGCPSTATNALVYGSHWDRIKENVTCKWGLNIKWTICQGFNVYMHRDALNWTLKHQREWRRWKNTIFVNPNIHCVLKCNLASFHFASGLQDPR